jgi:hypothetical protein
VKRGCGLCGRLKNVLRNDLCVSCRKGQKAAEDAKAVAEETKPVDIIQAIELEREDEMETEE